jgi:lipooligosaccharide transport system permease protein
MVTHRAYYVWLRNFTTYRTYIKPSLVTNVGEPLFFLFAMGFGIGAFIPEMEGMRYVDYIAPGLMVTSVMYSAVFECTFGSFTRMTVQKTYEAMLATPVSVADVVAGELLWGMTKGLISAFIVLLVLTGFGLYTPGFSVIPLMAMMAFVGFIFSAAALSFSAWAPSYEFFNYFFTILVSPMFFLSGVFFPIDRFPTALKTFAMTLPVTHAVDIARASFHGLPMPEYTWLPVMYLVGLSAGLGYFAFWMVKRRVVI